MMYRYRNNVKDLLCYFLSLVHCPYLFTSKYVDICL